MQGAWKLHVADTAAIDTGTVGCVQLQITQQFFFCCGVAGTPVVVAVPPATVVAESVVPPNNAPDPDETVTMSFPLRNVGSGLTNDLVATLLPGGGVLSPSGPQSYGALNPVDPTAVARNFTFVATGNCGDNITATFHLQDGATDLGNVTFTIRLGGVAVATPSFSNPTAITIPGTGTGAATGAPAAPYPSNITVSGVSGTVTKVTATIANFNHTFPSDVDILLVGPAGQKILLMSDVGGGTDAVNANITFDDSGPGIGATVVSGTFRPTNIGGGDLFPAPAPTGPYNSTALSDFNGLDPNGIWSLYVVDDAAIDTGNINGGWSLTITTETSVCNTSPCTLGVPADIVQGNDPGQNGAIVNFTVGVQGSCGIVTAVPPSGSFFPIGTTLVTVTGMRQDGTTTTATFHVTVTDVEGPVISNASANPSVLWPPNHKVVNVTVTYTVTDNHSPPSQITRTLSVTSNEPVNGTGDGDTAPDWTVVSPTLVKLRAERSGNGNGRIYTITITATDEAGNSSTQDVTVSVPHDQGH